MTCHKTYSCNFCGKSMRQIGGDGIGVSVVEGRVFKKPLEDAEKHICHNCLDVIQALPSTSK